jgi:tetratricopeptide (TPR) repeat protein
VAAAVLSVYFAVLVCPAYAVPGFVRDAAVPAKVPPAKDDWVASPRRAANLDDEAKKAFAAGREADALRLVMRAIETDHETNPSERDYYSLRAECLAALGDHGPEEAITLYNKAHRAADRGDFAAARRFYESVLVEDPLMLWAANNRAWLAATHPDREARRDPDAIAYALYACVKSEWHNWSFIDTLGAVYAESGDFASAERCAERALALAPPEQKREVRDSLADYRNKKPRRAEAAAAPFADREASVDPFAQRQFEDEEETKTPNAVLERVSLRELAQAMKREGYAVTIREERFIEWNIDGLKSQLFLTKDGSAIQFHAAFDDNSAKLAIVNDWNRTKRYSRSYLDDDGDPHLELDLAFDGGICQERVLDFLQTCRLSLSVWVKEVIR